LNTNFPFKVEVTKYHPRIMAWASSYYIQTKMEGGLDVEMTIDKGKFFVVNLPLLNCSELVAGSNIQRHLGVVHLLFLVGIRISFSLHV
jgi:hypothetical protein